MGITIALAGNPNCGKTTLFNVLTGSNQYVGNWPGVTVEKKGGVYKKDKSINIMDLPGIYSLSPYTLEEVVSREYLVNEKPDVILNVVDASNIERNLYLTTQLSEIGIPVVVALNMMDIVEKNGDKIDASKLSQDLGYPVIEISALKNRNIDKVIEAAKKMVNSKHSLLNIFDGELEEIVKNIESSVASIKDSEYRRWYAIKLFEKDKKAVRNLEITDDERRTVDKIIYEACIKYDDDSEGIITDARYSYISKTVADTVVKGRQGLTLSDKTDKILTNRILAIPIFVAVMFIIYYAAIKGGSPISDWINDKLFGTYITDGVTNLLESMKVAGWLQSLIVDGIIGGVGAVIGFLPLVAILYFFLAILEDIGYMSRIAFILDRIFRKFGLSGKSFIPILIGIGCAVPGIMATRTIENENDRKLTIIVAAFLPCGAKTEIIALFAASIFVGAKGWWFAPVCYFAGIISVIISGIILKKTKFFGGDPAPFVMELPEYHMPLIFNVIKTTWDRVKAFLVKAGTIILLAAIVIWFLQNISTSFEFVEFGENSHSILETIGKLLAPVFAPLGFGHWTAAVASITGLVAKELCVSTFGVVAGLGSVDSGTPAMLKYAATIFTSVSALSFMLFNQLCVPCFASVGAVREEMKSVKWTWLAIGYQMLFSYCIALMVYQFGIVLVFHKSFTLWTGIALAVLLGMIYLLVRKPKNHVKEMKSKSAVESQ